MRWAEGSVCSTHVEGPHAREDAGEVGAELGVGEEEEADAAVAVTEAVGGGDVVV